MLQVEQRPDPIERTTFIKTFPTWHGNGFDFLPAIEAANDSTFRSGICCAMAAESPDALNREDKKTWELALGDWYCSKQDGCTHSAAGFVLGQWKLALPAIAPTTQPQAWCPLVRQLDRHDDGVDPSRGVLYGFAGFR